jgi:hypothetical protein
VGTEGRQDALRHDTQDKPALRGVGGFGVEGVAAGDGVDGLADLIGGEAGAEEAAVERGDAALVEGTADGAEFAFQALVDQRGCTLCCESAYAILDSSVLRTGEPSAGVRAHV